MHKIQRSTLSASVLGGLFVTTLALAQHQTSDVVSDNATVFQPNVAVRQTNALPYQTIVESALPSVVKIYVTVKRSNKPKKGQEKESSDDDNVRSGIIIDSKGYIVTSSGGFEKVKVIEVTLNDQRRFEAKFLGADPDSGIAILKINGETPFPNITLGHDDELHVGDAVFAIGDAFNMGLSASSGIVSALNRSQIGLYNFENYIQTDAGSFSGGAGGALINAKGHLVGMNVGAMIDDKTTQAGSLGFAIPVSTLQLVADTIITTGRFSRGYIGISSQNLTREMIDTFKLPSDIEGVIIADIRSNGPAAQAGIQVGDV